MGEVEQFERRDLSQGEAYGSDPVRNGRGRKDPGPQESVPAPSAREPLSRPVGAPLPVGNTGRFPPQGHGLAGSSDPSGFRSMAPPPGRTLGNSPHADVDHSPAMQWAMGALKQAVPFIQRLLPLIDANIANAAAGGSASRPSAPASSSRIDLQPIESGVTELQTQHRELRTQVVEQNASLKRVEDHLEMVREATDRNTLEQQELIEDLKAMASKVNLFALSLLTLLVISVLLNLFLFLHIQRVLP